MEPHGLQADHLPPPPELRRQESYCLSPSDSQSSEVSIPPRGGKRKQPPRPRYRRWCFTLQFGRAAGHVESNSRGGVASPAAAEAGDSDVEGGAPAPVRRNLGPRVEEPEEAEQVPGVRRSQQGGPAGVPQGREEAAGSSSVPAAPQASREPRGVVGGAAGPSDEEVMDRAAGLEQLFRDSSHVTYYVFQLEKAPSTGGLHFQGYIRLSRAMDLAPLRKLFGPFNPHLEACKGNESENVAYCTKEETRVAGPWSHGELGRPGKRSDIQTAREIVSGGGRMAEVVDQVNSYQVSLFSAQDLVWYLTLLSSCRP